MRLPRLGLVCSMIPSLTEVRLLTDVVSELTVVKLSEELTVASGNDGIVGRRRGSSGNCSELFRGNDANLRGVNPIDRSSFMSEVDRQRRGDLSSSVSFAAAESAVATASCAVCGCADLLAI